MFDWAERFDYAMVEVTVWLPIALFLLVVAGIIGTQFVERRLDRQGQALSRLAEECCQECAPLVAGVASAIDRRQFQ